MLNFCDFIQFYVFTTNHHLNQSECNFSDRIVFKCWLVGCFGFNGPLRQYFSLYRAGGMVGWCDGVG